MKDNHGRISRWIGKLEEFNYSIRYIPRNRKIATDEQHKDCTIREFINHLSGQSDKSSLYFKERRLLTKRSHLEILDNTLYHLRGRGRKIIVNDVNCKYLQHLGESKTDSFIRDPLFWMDIGASVKSFILKCHSCQVNKSKKFTAKAGSLPINNKVRFILWHLDFTGPLPLTRKGNRFILVCIYHFSKWVEAVPLPDITAETAANVVFSNIRY
ncbi:hypothetical protein RF11_10809 [Thelohanellus kitauei]|uniref:Integrase catalytic domain-containing protein n=1 Tax=Thelohanellus kitauei TaxID=669202 RepID=A0A0C2MMJ6_THEKT|nr:hypothetical protein RF11_10809 [Thelohanellus kitauei]